MPTNKNAQIRYEVLDRCFSDFCHKYTFDDLLDAVNEKLFDLTGTSVSVRTLRDDIKYMSDRNTFNAPIKAIPIVGRKCYYRYANRNFSIYNNELTVEEVEKLKATLDVLNRYRGNPNYAWIEEILNSLQCRFGLKANASSVVSFEQNENLRGLQHLSFVIDATISQHTQNIHYKNFRGNDYEYIFHPYFVKQYNNRWFLFGRIEGKDRITNLALDRIEWVKKAETLFIENDITDFFTYFNNIIGVTRDNGHEVERILLRFDPTRFPYVVNKPIHHSQRVVDNGQGIIELTLQYNNELEAQIFYYGPQVEVLSPQWLRDHIATRIEENLKKYSIMQKDCTIGQ